VQYLSWTLMKIEIEGPKILEMKGLLKKIGREDLLSKSTF